MCQPGFDWIMVEGSYPDGEGFCVKEDHVWMDRHGFEPFSRGDSLSFTAQVYRYLKPEKAGIIDFGLECPENIRPCHLTKPLTDEQLVDQQICQLICEACAYFDWCNFLY